MMRPIALSILLSLLVGCAPVNVNGPPNTDIGGSTANVVASTQRLDHLEDEINSRRDLRVVDLGRTQAADKLSGYYNGSTLVEVLAVYEGTPPVTYRIYLDAQPRGAPTTALFVGDVLRRDTGRYYLVSGEVWVIDNSNGTPQAATASERDEVLGLLTAYVETLDRAARGIYDDPRAFGQE